MKVTNPNYCATVVRLEKFVDLSNCDNVKAAIIFHNSVIVGKDAKIGDVGLFFPVESEISHEFLYENSLYRKNEYGNKTDKTGFFERSRRVKAVKFRGHKSEGFWIPLSSADYLNADLKVGQSFNEINGIEIVGKYEPVVRGPKTKQAKKDWSLVPGQFAFHYDTENLKRTVDYIDKGSIVSITDKWHGTSAVFGNLLVSRKLSFWERCLKWLGFKIAESDYSIVWSSRSVIKGVGSKESDEGGYYDGTDLWTVVKNEIGSLIPRGYTVYGEIVGYTPEGRPIQKGYTYGCVPKEHRFLVYRVTSVNPDGLVIEFTWPQVRDFCSRVGLDTVPLLFYGPLDSISKDELIPEIQRRWVHDQECPYNPKMPSEGIVLKVDGSVGYKLKNFAFLNLESKLLDEGVVIDS